VDEEDFLKLAALIWLLKQADHLKLAALIWLLKQADHDIEFQSWWDVSEHWEWSLFGGSFTDRSLKIENQVKIPVWNFVSEEW